MFLTHHYYEGTVSFLPARGIIGTPRDGTRCHSGWERSNVFGQKYFFRQKVRSKFRTGNVTTRVSVISRCVVCQQNGELVAGGKDDTDQEMDSGECSHQMDSCCCRFWRTSCSNSNTTADTSKIPFISQFNVKLWERNRPFSSKFFWPEDKLVFLLPGSSFCCSHFVQLWRAFILKGYSSWNC